MKHIIQYYLSRIKYGGNNSYKGTVNETRLLNDSTLLYMSDGYPKLHNNHIYSYVNVFSIWVVAITQSYTPWYFIKILMYGLLTLIFCI